MSSDLNSEYPLPNKWMVLLIVATNGFLIILDMSIVNISFPALTAVFQTDMSVVLWVTVVFALVSAGLTPVFGKLADIFGHRNIFFLGYIIFTAGLVFCSMAQSISQLIFFRGIQGLGAAMNLSLSFAIVSYAFPIEQRGKALGIMTSVFSIGPLVGFTIGGLLIDLLSWQALFYTRIPLCVLGVFMAWRYMGIDLSVRKIPKLDVLGAGLLFSSITCVILFLNMGGREGFDMPHILVLGGAGLLLFVLFVLQELNHEQPIVDLGLYKIPRFRAASISLVVVVIVQSGQILLLPFLLQRGFAYTALEAGLILAVLPVLHFVVAPWAGVLSDKLGTKPLCVAGMCFLFLGLLMMTRLTATSDLYDIIATFVLTGIGGGLFNAPITSQIMTSATREQLGSVGALATTTRQIAMTCSFVISEIIFTARQTHYNARLPDNGVSQETLAQMALIEGFNDTMMLSAILCLCGILFFTLSGRHSR